MSFSDEQVKAISRRVVADLVLGSVQVDPREAILAASDHLVEAEGRKEAAEALRQLADEIEDADIEDFDDDDHDERVDALLRRR